MQFEHRKWEESFFQDNMNVIWGYTLELIHAKHNKLAFTHSAAGVIPDPTSFIAHNMSKYATTSMQFHFTIQHISLDNKHKSRMHPIENKNCVH